MSPVRPVPTLPRMTMGSASAISFDPVSAGIGASASRTRLTGLRPALSPRPARISTGWARPKRALVVTDGTGSATDCAVAVAP
ncbi:hypothetical protein G6F64_015603 [Rhizopus arrhizus]|uniref:Uncharacterized protein n=1 Tax=Rhizopus oryzae TaxID=64495 RepID=A0A9P7BIP0_RHIOR|nr:hypothetical protein G6F64_015603 [Rhizopus arrhizus]